MTNNDDFINIFNTIANLDSHIDLDICKILNKPHPNEKTIIVMSGGGIRGIAHVGALNALYKLDMLTKIRTVAGTSIGAFIGFMYVIGYTPKEIYEFVTMFNFNKIKSFNASNFLGSYGLDDGKKVEVLVRKLATSKNIPDNITFIDLFKLTGYEFIVTGTCLNDKSVHYFSYKTHPRMSVILAVRISMAFPLYYQPITYNNNTYVDGGCIDNYPIRLFTSEIEQVIGLYLAETFPHVKSITNTENFIFNLIQCFLSSRDVGGVVGFEKYSVIIPISSDVNILDFNLGDTLKLDLYSNGYNSAMKQFNKDDKINTHCVSNI
jgi:NTE family protein